MGTLIFRGRASFLHPVVYREGFAVCVFVSVGKWGLRAQRRGTKGFGCVGADPSFFNLVLV
jgi:hypothetical protein